MKLIQRMFIKQLLAVLISCVVAVVLYIVVLSIQVNLSSNTERTEHIDETIMRIQQYKQIEETILSLERPLTDINSSMLQALALNLQQVHSHLLVIENDEIIFNPAILQSVNRDYIITQVKNSNNELKTGKFTFELYQFKVEGYNVTYNFLFKKSKKLSVTTISFITAALSFLITYVICCLYINYRLNRKLITPIMKLKDAAFKISQGELDSIISLDTQDEVDDLAKSLEFLRIKLKEAIRLQHKYDDNRSFLISSISHDLRTPVTTIKGYVEALRDGVANTPEKEKQYLYTIDKKANQINEMIEDLLLYSKLDLNQLPFTFTNVNIIKYLQDGVDEQLHYFEQQQVHFEFKPMLTKPYSVKLDLNRFMRVIQNIWDNAISYNDKDHKEISMSVRETFTSIVIEIKDNGKGLEETEAEQIFDRFYRNDRARQAEHGSGLGLAIAKHIIKEHDGQIWAKGERGKGTSIFISLPKVKE